MVCHQERRWRDWLLEAGPDRDAGQRPDGPTTDEREELRRPRREYKILREEREIPRKEGACHDGFGAGAR